MNVYGNGGEYNGPMQGSALTGINNVSVGTEMERAEKASAQLHALLDQLFARLEPILAPTPPSVAGSGAAGTAPEPSMSGVVRLLKAQGSRVDAASQRISELLQRIEL